MKYRTLFTCTLFIALAWSLTSCNDDDDTGEPTPPPTEAEGEINAFSLTLEDAEGAQLTQTFAFYGPDVAGGNPPSVDPIGTALGGYLVNMVVYDATDYDNPTNLTARIEDNGTDYQIFYEFLNGAEDAISFEYADTDANGNAIGLFTLWGAVGLTTGGEMVRFTIVKGHDKDAPAAVQGVFSEDFGGEVILQGELDLIVY